MAALPLAGLFNSQLAAAPAAVSTVDGAERSAHFDAVNRHLELGGVLYGYMDVDGDVAKLGAVISDAVGKATEINPMLAMAQQNYAQIFAELGLTDIKAVGLSSVREGEGFRNRSFFYIPEGRRGLLAIVGGSAKPFANTALAPADTDLFFEAELDTPTAYAALRAVVARIGGEGLANMLEGELKKPTPAGVTSYEAIQQLSGRYTAIVKLDAENRIELPNGVSLPGVSVFVKADGLAPIFEKLLKEGSELAKVTADGRTFFETTEAAPGTTTLKPVFLFEDGAFVIGSSRAFAWECLGRKSGGLAEQVDFQKALASVGAEGNGLCYVTPRVFSELKTVLSGVKAAEPQAAGAIDFWTGNLPELTQPLVSVRSNLPEGILTRSYSFRSLKQEVLIGANGPVTIGLLAAMAIPAFQKVRANSQEKTIQNNLRLFSSLARQHMIETGKEQATFAELIETEGGDLLKEFKPVRGEDYTTLVLKADDTEISITTASGEVISMPVY